MDDPYALHVACSLGNFLKVKELLKDPEKDFEWEDSFDLNPIGCAIKSGYLHIVQFLLEKVGNVNYPNSGLMTPLHCACASGMIHIVQWLLDNGANPNLQEGWGGSTPMYCAIELENQEKKIDIIKRLLKHGADPWILDRSGNSVISLAFQLGDLSLVRLLKDNDLYKTVKSAATPFTEGFCLQDQNLLYLAVKSGNKDVVSFLVDTGVDFKDTKKIGFDFLSLVCVTNNVDLVKFAWKTVYKGSPPDSSKIAAIHIAAGRCEVPILKLLIELGCNCNVLNNYLETPLLTALVYEKLDNVEFLLERGLDVNEKRFDGKNALHIYCQHVIETGPVLEKIIAGIRDINDTDHAQRTPLHYAAIAGFHDIIKSLIKHGADPKAVDSKRATALHYLSGVEFVEWDSWAFDCLAKGVGTEPLDEQRKTPLHYAAEANGGQEYFEELIGRGANMEAVSDDKGSVLHHTLAAHQWSKAKFLLQKGVFNDKPNKEGKTPLLYSIRSIELAKTLLDKGANIHALDNEGQTVLHLACQRIQYNEFYDPALRPDDENEYLDEIMVQIEEVVKVLLERASNVNAADKHGRTPLHMAFDSRTGELINILLSYGADKKAVDNDGRNILHYVVQNYASEIVENLFDASLNVADKNGHRPLFYASSPETLNYIIEHTDNIKPDEFKDFFPMECIELTVECLETVFERGASANTTNETGNTMLHEFTTNTQIDQMKFLLERGADVNAKNKDLVTPLHLAAERSYDSVKLLVENGADVAALDKDGKTPRDYFREKPKRCDLMFNYL